MSEGSQVSSDDEARLEVAPPIRGGGFPLPSLRHWRFVRRLEQTELAEKADLSQDYLSKVESGTRGCNREAAEKLAEVLRVDLEELRKRREEKEDEQGPSRLLRRPRTVYKQVHQAYLRVILIKEVGSAYVAKPERELEKHCEKIGWQEVIEVIWARKKEISFLRELMEDESVSAQLPEEVRSFLGGLVEDFPDLDIRLLAAARRREGSEEGREALTKALRDLL